MVCFNKFHCFSTEMPIDLNKEANKKTNKTSLMNLPLISSEFKKIFAILDGLF